MFTYRAEINAGAGPSLGSGAMPTGPMTMGPRAGSGPRGPMGSGSLGMGAMNNSLMPGGMGVSRVSSLYLCVADTNELKAFLFSCGKAFYTPDCVLVFGMKTEASPLVDAHVSHCNLCSKQPLTASQSNGAGT